MSTGAVSRLDCTTHPERWQAEALEDDAQTVDEGALDDLRRARQLPGGVGGEAGVVDGLPEVRPARLVLLHLGDGHWHPTDVTHDRIRRRLLQLLLRMVLLLLDWLTLWIPKGCVISQVSPLLRSSMRWGNK